MGREGTGRQLTEAGGGRGVLDKKKKREESRRNLFPTLSSKGSARHDLSLREAELDWVGGPAH